MRCSQDGCTWTEEDPIHRSGCPFKVADFVDPCPSCHYDLNQAGDENCYRCGLALLEGVKDLRVACPACKAENFEDRATCWSCRRNIPISPPAVQSLDSVLDEIGRRS